MRRAEGGKHLRANGRWMRPSERIVFLTLLERSDNGDCSIPAFVTPSIAQLADATGYTASAATEALRHLEKHGWVIRQRSPGGRGHKSAYQLGAGNTCEADSPAACLRPPKQSDGSDGLAQKQSDGSYKKLSDEPTHNRRPNAVSGVGHRRGEVKEGPTAKQAEHSEGLALCRICQLAMDPVLPANGFTTHPCCDPDEISPMWPQPVKAVP